MALPTEISSFIGREQQIGEVKQLLQRHRLVTLVGAGGCGKSRLALRVAADLHREIPGGVWFVELASVTDGAAVVQAVAYTLGISKRPSLSLESTVEQHLRDKQSLVVMDNCEHLLEGCAALTVKLLKACPGLRILATSRERLAVRGEAARQVPALTVPEAAGASTPEDLLRYEATQLFLDRASSVNAAVDLCAENVQAIRQICHRLDGMPLAIELAAARTTVLSVRQIAERLESSLGLLAGISRDALPHHQTMRATLDWSFRLLSGPEQQLWRRLSVFAGDFRLDAVEAVCSGQGIDEHEVFELLSLLVNRSVVIVRESAGEVRYRLLEVLRQYGAEKLQESGESLTYHRRHLVWYRRLAEQAAGRLSSSDQVAWLDRIEQEHDNLRKTLHWSLGQGETEAGQHIACALHDFWSIRGYPSEGRRWLEAFLQASPGGSALRVAALSRLGMLAKNQGDYLHAAAAYQEGLALLDTAGDEPGMAKMLNSLGTLYRLQGDSVGASAALERALGIHQAKGDQLSGARVLGNLGLTALDRGDHTGARARLEQAMAIFQATGDKVMTATTLNNLGLVASEQGDLARARLMYEQGLALQREVGHKHGIARSQINLGELLLKEGRHDEALPLFEEAETTLRQLEDQFGIALSQVCIASVAYHRKQYGTAVTSLLQAIQYFSSVRNQQRTAEALELLGEVVISQGEPERCVALYAAAEAIRKEIGPAVTAPGALRREQLLAAARTRLSAQGFSAAWEYGLSLTPDQAIELVTAETGLPPKSDCAHGATRPVKVDVGPSLLTVREAEIAFLVGQGLTVKQIAERLYVSWRTVGVHEQRIREKLGLPNRSSLAAWAVHQGVGIPKTT